MTADRSIPTGYNTEIPRSIMTSDTVETPLGILNLFDGLPDEASVQKLYDKLIFIRGVETFLRGDSCHVHRSTEGKEANWIQTVPGKGWVTVLRLYGPLEPWFDKAWKPGEIVLAG